MDKLYVYAKGVWAAALSALTVWSAVTQDGAISLAELDTLRTAILALLTVVGVVKLRNRPAA